MPDVNIHIDSTREWRLLGYLTDPKFYPWIDMLKPALFTAERVKVFEAIQQSYRKYGDVTPEGIEVFLGKQSPAQLDVPVGTNIEGLVDCLVDVARRRQAHSLGSHLQELSSDPSLTVDRIHKALEFQPIMQDEDAEVLPGSQILLANYRRKKEGTYDYVSTGIPTLDSYMRGEWQIGFTLLGALSGTGKTALALQSMMEMARLNIPSMMICLEMEKDALIERMAANIAMVDSSDIAVGELTDDEETRFEHAVNYINNLPIKLISNGDLDVGQIIAHIREWANKGYKVFFIDHLQLIKSSNDNRNNALGEISWALKMIANKLKIRIVVLTQLTKKDGGYEVRDSGEVRPKAETFIVLSTDSDADKRTVMVTFEKNRSGRLGAFPLLFEAKYQKFTDTQAKRSLAAD